MRTKPHLLAESAVTRPVASYPLEAEFWNLKTIKGPKAFIALSPMVTLEEIVDKHYKALISSIGKIFQQKVV